MGSVLPTKMTVEVIPAITGTLEAGMTSTLGIRDAGFIG
jgi:hypothetical protein